jgi:HSP20 family protein
MDRLVSESFVPSRGQSSSGGLAVDVQEKDNEFVVTTPMPGVKPDDIDISVLGDMLRIRGERREQHQQGSQQGSQQGKQTAASSQQSSQQQTQKSNQQGDQQGSSGQRWLLREQRFGSFERMVRLPTAVKAEDAKADLNDGVLTITLPKAESARQRRIPVQAGSHGQGQEIEVESGNSSGSSGSSSKNKQQNQQNQQSQQVHS